MLLQPLFEQLTFVAASDYLGTDLVRSSRSNKCKLLYTTLFPFTGLEFNYTVRNFLCPWHWLLIDFNVIRDYKRKFVLQS